MRTFMGKLGAIAGPLLRAIPILLLIFAAFCQAQCPGATTPPTSPTTWYAGQNNNFNFQGSNGAAICSSPGVGCEVSGGLTTALGVDVPGAFICINSDLASGTVTLPADTPTETATLTLQFNCDRNVDEPCPNDGPHK
jgi:hypothetical protein